MKKIIILLLILGFTSVAIAQEKTEPDKQTTTIFVKIKGDSKSIYKTFGSFLMDNGFVIEKSDPEFLTVVTQAKSLARHPGWSHTWFMNLRFSDNKITIRPFWQPNVELSVYGVKSVNNPFEWHFGKAKSNVENMIFEEIKELILKFPESEISFN